jgi:hypothetical protein
VKTSYLTGWMKDTVSYDSGRKHCHPLVGVSGGQDEPEPECFVNEHHLFPTFGIPVCRKSGRKERYLHKSCPTTPVEETFCRCHVVKKGGCLGGTIHPIRADFYHEVCVDNSLWATLGMLQQHLSKFTQWKQTSPPKLPRYPPHIASVQILGESNLLQHRDTLSQRRNTFYPYLQPITSQQFYQSCSHRLRSSQRSQLFFISSTQERNPEPQLQKYYSQAVDVMTHAVFFCQRLTTSEMSTGITVYIGCPVEFT